MPRFSLQSGFSLIEMIVSLALFSVVATISVGALLVLIASNQQLQTEQSIMTNLSFALDSMTREIRTGTNYYCSSRNNAASGPQNRRIFEDGRTLDSDVVGDCADGRNPAGAQYHGIAFVEGGQSITGAVDTKIVYFYDADPDGDASTADGSLFRRVSGEDAQAIVSSGIEISDAQFYVTSSERLEDGDDFQPLVTIYVEAKDPTDPTGKIYKIQTTVTQRILDL
jgi:prepilin-type N-terminal cleavage/methylation domain-containing protein